MERSIRSGSVRIKDVVGGGKVYSIGEVFDCGVEITRGKGGVAFGFRFVGHQRMNLQAFGSGFEKDDIGFLRV